MMTRTTSLPAGTLRARPAVIRAHGQNRPQRPGVAASGPALSVRDQAVRSPGRGTPVAVARHPEPDSERGLRGYGAAHRPASAAATSAASGVNVVDDACSVFARPNSLSGAGPKATPDPVAIARLVRDGRSAEIAFEVANDYQQRGIGTALTEELLADARAAGIAEITALVTADNPTAISLLRRALAYSTSHCKAPNYRSAPPSAPVTKQSAIAPAAPLGQLARLDRRDMNVPTPS